MWFRLNWRIYGIVLNKKFFLKQFFKKKRKFDQNQEKKGKLSFYFRKELFTSFLKLIDLKSIFFKKIV